MRNAKEKDSQEAYATLPDFDRRLNKDNNLKVLFMPFFVSLIALGAYKFKTEEPVQILRNPNSMAVTAALKTILKITESDFDYATTAKVKKDLETGIIPVSLQKSSPQLIENIKNGIMNLYSFRVLDSTNKDGGTVEISVDGQPLDIISMSHTGLTLLIPLEFGKSKIIKVKAIRDGGGGVSFGAQLMNSDFLLRNMKIGESETIYLGYGK